MYFILNEVGMFSTIAIITARGGSKRIPRKNIKNFMGKPMLAYAIEAALNSQIFDEVMVSTDDLEIAQVAKEYGANVPFMRSEKNSDDYASTYDVLEEVILEYKKNKKIFNNVCCIYPCVPFLKVETLKKAYNNFINTNCSTLIPIVRFSYPVQRAFVIKDEKLKFREPQYKLARSQDLEATFHDVGMFYFMNTDEILKQRTIFTDKMSYFELCEVEIQDIDTMTDWEIAEQKYKIRKFLN